MTIIPLVQVSVPEWRVAMAATPASGEISKFPKVIVEVPPDGQFIIKEDCSEPVIAVFPKFAVSVMAFFTQMPLFVGFVMVVEPLVNEPAVIPA